MANPGTEHAELAPAPSFRYVGLDRGPSRRIAVPVGVFGVVATVASVLTHGFGVRGLVASALSTGFVAWNMRRVLGPRVAGSMGETRATMGIVPWGVLVEPDDRPRTLRWSAVKRVEVTMVHGSDQGTPQTLWSVVTVETDRDRFVGRSPGAVSIDDLVVHLPRYEEEASHVVAYDLDGESPGVGPAEPDVEGLLLAARAWLESPPSSTRLGLAPQDYRRLSAKVATRESESVLKEVLRERRVRSVDPRAFAAVVCAEIGARGVLDDVLSLVQSPHPVVAAVAKVAAIKLGAPPSKVGTLDEVAPFLHERDVEALRSWST
ncbi:MAG: hypothetical protein U0169_14550 [Polyangiaceae bacterium]